MSGGDMLKQLLQVLFLLVCTAGFGFSQQGYEKSTTDQVFVYYDLYYSGETAKLTFYGAEVPIMGTAERSALDDWAKQNRFRLEIPKSELGSKLDLIGITVDSNLSRWLSDKSFQSLFGGGNHWTQLKSSCDGGILRGPWCINQFQDLEDGPIRYVIRSIWDGGAYAHLEELISQDGKIRNLVVELSSSEPGSWFQRFEIERQGKGAAVTPYEWFKYGKGVNADKAYWFRPGPDLWQIYQPFLDDLPDEVAVYYGLKLPLVTTRLRRTLNPVSHPSKKSVGGRAQAKSSSRR